jgi:5-methylcytosine-specific restriction enzyme subunit McrC
LHVADRRVRDVDVRNSARVSAGVIGEICEAHTQDPDWYAKAIRYGRRNARYRPAHELAKLVLKGLALTDKDDRSATTSTSFMVDMNAIFERFVTRLVVNSLAGTELRATPQKTVRAIIIDEYSGQTYSKIRPDLIVEEAGTGRTVPIDVKYKLYDLKKFSSADIYQSFVYAYSVGTQSSSTRAGLIYPSTTPISGPALYIKPISGAKPARIRGAGLDVSAALDDIGGPDEVLLHARVLAMIREITDLQGGSNGALTTPTTVGVAGT